MPTILLRVEGMRDAEDEARVEGALRRERGVFGAVANAEESCAEIDCDEDEVAIDRLIEVVRDTGFRAEVGG